MANRTAILAIRIISDARNATQGLNDSASAVDRWQSGLGKAAAVATGVAAGMVAIGAASVQAASDAQQAAGAVESVFGNAATAVKKYGDAAAQTVGLATSQYNQMASVLGAQLQALGSSQAESATRTNELIELGADLAATFGGTTADAVGALGALFRGEADPIERYGVSIKQSDVNARLAAEGLGKLDGEAKKQAETQARLALLYEQTSGAQGQFARESDTLSGQQQRLAAEFENTKAKLGEALLPILTQVAEAFAGVARWAGENTTAFWVIAGVAGTLAVALIAANAALTAWQVIQGIVAIVNTAATVSWGSLAVATWAALWPILAIIAVIAAVIAIIYLVITHLDTLRGWWDIAFEAGRTAVQWCWDKLQALGSWISGAFQAVVSSVGDFFSKAFDVAKRVVEAMLAPINAVINAVKSLIGWISNIRFPSMPSWISNLNPFSRSAVADPAEGMLSARGAAAVRSGGMFSPFSNGVAPKIAPKLTNIQINVTGAIDPVQTGRQIKQALTTSGRALGNTNAVLLSDNRGTY